MSETPVPEETPVMSETPAPEEAPVVSETPAPEEGGAPIDPGFSVTPGAPGAIETAEPLDEETEALQFLGGTGTEAEPYLLRTAEDIKALQQAVNTDGLDTAGVYFKQIDNITMTGDGWTGIGAAVTPFKGIYDGGNHTITGLNGTSGLFDTLGGDAAMCNVTIEDAQITVTTVPMFSGALANQYLGTDATVGLQVENCHITGVEISSSPLAAGTAGLIGMLTGGKASVKDCTVVECTITSAKGDTGGLLGSLQTDEAYIEGCVVTNGTIDNAAMNGTGGLVGQVKLSADGTGEVSNCAVTGSKVNADQKGGGLIGAINASTAKKVLISGCFTDVEVELTNTMGGGLIGYANFGTLENCVAVGAVNGTYNIGGAVGSVSKTFSMEHVVAAGKVTGSDDFSVAAGGLVGAAAKTVSVINSVAMQEVLDWGTEYQEYASVNLYRIIGGSTVCIAKDNYAFAQMLVLGKPQSSEDGASQQGADVSAAQLKSEEFWKNILGFDFGRVWEWDNNQPKLQALPETVEQHIAIPEGSLRIVSQPEDAVVYPYDTEASFSVTAIGDWDTLTYQWQSKTGDGEWTDIAGNESATAATLTVPVQYGQDYLTYRCVVAESGIENSVITAEVKLTDLGKESIPTLSNLTFSGMYNGQNPYEMEPDFTPETKEYEVYIPEASYISGYFLPEMKEEQSANYRWRYAMIDAEGNRKISNYDYQFSTSMQSFNLSNYVGIEIDILDAANKRVVNRYSIDILRVPYLKDISVANGAILKTEFNKDLTEFEVYLTGNDGFEFTLELMPKDGVLTLGENTYASGDTVKVPADAIQDNKVTFVVSGPAGKVGYDTKNYTLNMVEPPRNQEPTFISQEMGTASYTVDEAAEGITPLSVYATANVEVQYQWYKNDVESAEGAQKIDGATANTYIPDVSTAERAYYYCVATANGKSVTSSIASITVYPKLTAQLEILTPGEKLPAVPGVGFEQETGYYYTVGATNVTSLEVAYTTDIDAEFAKDITERVSWSIKTGTSMTGGSGNPLDIDRWVEKQGAYYFTPKMTLTLGNQSLVLQAPSAIYVHVQDPIELKIWEGAGSAEDPYQIETQEDLNNISAHASEFSQYAGLRFKLQNDLTLTDGWKQLPSNFKGTFDGGGHTLTFPKGSKALIGGAIGATVQNLNISCPYIKGDGLVENYGGGQSLGACIDIINVTIKSGTAIEGAGFLSGTGATSGSRTVNIINCTVEDGVKIGYDAEKNAPSNRSNIGSFAGAFNGTVQDSKSYATVYGVNNVGGLLGSKCQSMGLCKVSNSMFGGEIIATGEYVGGIIGRGYTHSTAPNTPAVSIQNCYVTGSIQGRDYIGGMFGGEPGLLECWDNGIGYIQNNHFVGSIKAQGDHVGGIVGYMASLNKYNIISNNYYLESCGAQKGIGGVQYVDTSCATHETASGAQYFDTSVALPGIGGDSGFGPAGVIKTDHNRTDDPLGADADKLTKSVTAEQMQDGTVTGWLNQGEGSYQNWKDGPGYPVLSDEAVPLSLELSGDFKREYYIGEELDLSGAVFTVVMSDGTRTQIDTDEVVIAGFDSSHQALLTLTATYGAVRTEFAVKILKPVEPGQTEIEVSFRLLGDEAHDSEADGQIHTLRDNNLDTWIPETTYTMDINATVADVFKKALEEHDLEYLGDDNNQYDTLYISGIQIPGTSDYLEEFTNGPRSGWMYTLNGTHPELGVSQQFLEDGDVIVFHYTDDYTKEEGSDKWEGGADEGAGVGGDVVIAPPVSAGKDGVAEVKISESELKDAIAEAKSGKADAIVITPEIKGEATEIAIELPKGTISKMTAQTEAELALDTPVGQMTIPHEALKAIVDEAGSSDITVTLRSQTAAEAAKYLADMDVTQEQLKGASVVEVSIASGKKSITSFDGESITLTLPVYGDGFEAGKSYTVYQISEDGTVEKLTCKCKERSKTLYVELSTTHLSTFVVLPDGQAEELPFTDVKENDWFYEAVSYVYAYDLLKGTSETTFSPNAAMSRSMLITALWRLEGEPEAPQEAEFSDVTKATWYSEAVAWANSAGIVTGSGGRFDPDGNVTREQIATILYRYAKVKGWDMDAASELTDFSDSGIASEWAVRALEWAYAEGFITGKDGNRLDPKGQATRAEVAMVIMRLVKSEE